MVKTRRNDRLAFFFAILAAIFLFVSGTSGKASWLKTEELVLQYIDAPWMNLLFIILIIIASLGAFSVFLGGYLILKKRTILGRIFIMLGSGAGILTICFNLLFSVVTLNVSMYTNLSLSSLGVIFAVAAQIVAGDKHKKRWYKRLFGK